MSSEAAGNADNSAGWGEASGWYEEIVFSEPRPGVAVIRMNRPEDMNPWTRTMSAELVHAMDRSRHADHIGAIVFTGTGRAFCAGGEATTILPTYIDSEDALKWARDAALLNIRNVLQVLKDFDKPMIAAVNGVAAGAAFGMVAMCDIRIASEAGRFGNIYMRRGTVPSMAPYFLPQVIGLSRACRLIFADEVIGAREAERIGLVSRVVSAEELPGVTLSLAERIAAQPIAKLRLVKHLIRAGQDTDYHTLRRLGALSAVVSATTVSEN
jgi:2-(1,2-epoxy-1,2-dihydrophenyl)acetyl-CoA isomerase